MRHGTVVALIALIFFGSLAGIIFGLWLGADFGVAYGLSIGLWVGLSFGLVGGGSELFNTMQFDYFLRTRRWCHGVTTLSSVP